MLPLFTKKQCFVLRDRVGGCDEASARHNVTAQSPSPARRPVCSRVSCCRLCVLAPRHRYREPGGTGARGQAGRHQQPVTRVWAAGNRQDGYDLQAILEDRRSEDDIPRYEKLWHGHHTRSLLCRKRHNGKILGGLETIETILHTFT